MLLYVIYITRIFSEVFRGLSAFLGGFIIYVYILSRLKLRPSSADPKKENPFNPFLVFLLVYMVLHLLWISVAYINFGRVILFQSIYFTLKIVAIIALYNLVKSEVLLKYDKIENLLGLVTYIYACISLYNIFSVITGRVERASWPCHHPNSLGIVLAILSWFRITATGSNKIRGHILAFVLICGMLATKSLSALVIFFITLILYSLFSFKLKYILPIFILVFLCYYFVGNIFIGERLQDLSFNLHDYVHLWKYGNIHGFASSFEWRIVNWRSLFDQFLKNPWFGYGTSSWLIVNPMREYSGILGGYQAHSETLTWLIQFGLIGTFILAFVFLKTVFFYLKINKDSKCFKPFGLIFSGLLIGAILGKAMLSVLLFSFLILIYFYCKNIEIREKAISQS